MKIFFLSYRHCLLFILELNAVLNRSWLANNAFCLICFHSITLVQEVFGCISLRASQKRSPHLSVCGLIRLC